MLGSDWPHEYHPIGSVEVVIRVGRRTVQALRPGPGIGHEAEAEMEADRDRVAGPGDGHHPSRAGGEGVALELPVERPPDAATAMTWCDADQVADCGRRMIGRDKADKEANEPGRVILGKPGRASEVLEPQPRQLVDLAPLAPPVIDDRRDRGIVRFRRAAIPYVRAQRPLRMLAEA